MHGQFVWYELTTPDVDAAKRFYTKFTGWGTQKFDDDYTMWTTNGVPFAGIFKLGPDMSAMGVPPNWMSYIETNNVDETARQATSLGGRVMHGPADIPGTGRFAVLQDPQGATFGVYKSSRPSQAWDGTAVLDRFSWHELMTTDWEKAFDFYRKLFGWEQVGDVMDMGGGNKYFMYGQQPKMYGGIYNRMPEMASIPPFWLVYIYVKDVQRAVDIAVKNGAALVRGPLDIPGGKIAILGDPQGAAFALHASTPAAVTQPAPATKKAASRPTASTKSKTSVRSKAAARSKAAPSKTVAKSPPKSKAKPKKLRTPARRRTARPVAKKKRTPKKAQRGAAARKKRRR